MRSFKLCDSHFALPSYSRAPSAEQINTHTPVHSKHINSTLWLRPPSLPPNQTSTSTGTHTHSRRHQSPMQAAHASNLSAAMVVTDRQVYTGPAAVPRTSGTGLNSSLVPHRAPCTLFLVPLPHPQCHPSRGHHVIAFPTQPCIRDIQPWAPDRHNHAPPEPMTVDMLSCRLSSCRPRPAGERV